MFKKVCRKLFYMVLLTMNLALLTGREVFAQSFPYQISVETISGHCYDDGHLIFTLLDNIGNEIQIDSLTHNAVDITQYPLYNVHYHYQNVSGDLGVHYDYDNDIMLSSGTYCVGVVAEIPAPGGGYTEVDTTFCNVQVTTSYQHLEASALFNLASSNWNDIEMSGWRPSFTCADLGRIQLHIVQGSFPYEVTILNEQQDTVRHTFFSERVNSGNVNSYANYRDYYTFDHIPVGTYSIFVSDSCGYTVGPLSFVIPNAEPSSYGSYINVKNYSCPTENVAPFAISISHTSEYNNSYSWYNYLQPYFDSILQYRFINPGNDTTEWKVVVPSSVYSSYFNYIDDTLPNYCVIFNDTVTLQIRDLCHDTIITQKFLFQPQFDFVDSAKSVHTWDAAIPDTCGINLESGVLTQSYKFAGEKGAIFSQTGTALIGWTNQVREIPFRYFRCPLSYNVWSMPDSTLLSHVESDDFTGLGSWVTFDVDTSIQIHISVTDAEGCEVAVKDTLLEYHPVPLDSLYFWFECRNEIDDDGKDHCCEDRYLWIQEHGVEANTFRRNMTLRLIESPLYNQFNFTAIRQNGVWNVTFDDPTNHTSYLDFSYPDGWRATLRDSVCLPPGRYIFEVSTDCGVDTVIKEWAGFYYDTHEFTSAPQYEMEQVCDRIVATIVSTGVEAYVYFIDPSVSNDVPIQEECPYRFVSSSSSGINPIEDSQGRKVYTFSVPGTYYITNYVYNMLSSSGVNTTYVDCIDYCYHYDTITVAFSYLDFETASALLCDLSSTTGIVSAQAINGNSPYTYTLYDQWDASGNIMATNSTGFFDNVPMTVGQHFSVQVIDSCSTTFSVNITAALLTHGSLVWEEDANSGPHCAGDTVQLTAMNFPPPATYLWSGPNGFSSTSQTIDAVLPDYSENGWFTVEILNSNICNTSISDSILIPMAPSPQVTILGDSLVCPGTEVTLSFVAQGTGQVSFDIFHSDEYQAVTVAANNSLTQTFPIQSSEVFWVDHIADNYCSSHASVDSFHVGTFFVNLELSDIYDTICQGSGYDANGFTLTVAETDTIGTITRMYSAPDSNGCLVPVELHLKVNPVVTSSFAQSVCESFTWNDMTYIENGSHTQSFTSTSGCDSVVTLQLTIGGPPEVSVAVAKDTICPGESILLNAVVGNVDWLGPESSGSLEYLWSNGSTESQILVTLEESALYTVTVTVNGECSNTAEKLITVRNVMPQSDTVFLCENDSVTITAQHTPPFLWSTGDTTQSITVSSEGDYTVSLSDAYGCYFDSTVHVILIPSIPVTSLFVTVLENELPYTINDSSYQAEGSYTQTLTSAMGCDSVLTIELTVLYNIDNQLDSTICENELPFLWNDSLFTEEGTKITIIPASNGVDSIVSMTLHTRPLPSAQISGTNFLCTDSSGTISVDSAVTYLWDSGDTTQSIVVNTFGLHSVTVTDEYGCANSATHKVIELIVNPIEAIQIPALCAGGSDTILVGRNQESHILIGQYDSIPLLSDEVIQSDNIFTASTNVVFVEVENPWAVSVSDTSFAISIPEGLTQDTTIGCVLHLYNAFGCRYDTTVAITCHNLSQSEFDTTVCNLLLWNEVAYTASGQYLQTFENVNGCDSVVTVNLTVNYSPEIYDTLELVQNQLPYYFAPMDTIFGMNAASFLSFSYWRTGNQGCDTLCNQTVIVYQNTQHTEDTTVCASELPFTWHGHIFTEAGSHTDTLLLANGSDSVCIYMLSVDLVTAAINSPTHIVCFGASTGAASATVTGGVVPMDYVWTNALGTTVSTTVQISNQPSGFYTFSVTDQLGCSATDTVTLQHLNGELLPGSITDDQEACEGDLLMDFFGTAASGGDNSVYQWQISTDNADWDAAPGTNNGQNYSYTLPVSNSFALRRAWISQSCGTGYSNTVTITVGVNSTDTIMGQICQNTPYLEFDFDIPAEETAEPGTYTFEKHYPVGICDSIVVLLLTVNATSYTELQKEACGSYSWNGITYYEPGNYNQNFVTADGCDSLVQLQLSIIDTMVEIVPLTEDFCEEMSAELSVITELADYVWNTGEEMPTITVTVPGTYSVTASQGDCRNSASYTVSSCELRVFLPNAITPSRSDGRNDCFSIPDATQAIMHSFEISIFNRWGEQVFYSTDKNFRWNGEIKGTIFYNTVYTYIIRYTDANGKPYYVTGSVTVL